MLVFPLKIKEKSNSESISSPPHSLIQRRSQTAAQAFYDLTAGIDDRNEDGSSPSAPHGVSSGEEMNTHQCLLNLMSLKGVVLTE